MNGTRLTTGILLVVVPLVFTLGFTGLQMSFGYPAILRLPAADILNQFAAAGTDVHIYWYAMFAAALGLIPAAVGVAFLGWQGDKFLAALTAVFGGLAGLVQALGLLRWVMLVPGLAAAYVVPGATDLDRALATSIFDATNHYLGMGVGEHLGYLFTALWTAGLALQLIGRWRAFAIAGLVLAAGVASGMLEPFGVAGAGTVNALSFSAWALWALILGLLVLRRSPVAETTALAA